MARKTDAEIGQLVRKAIAGRRIRKRRQFDSTERGPNIYMESDEDFLANNRYTAVNILEALLVRVPADPVVNGKK